ncbi:MAG: hypothetical protein R6V07_03310 [Armatimonadota bacterium]
MADINLDFLSPEKREFLRRRAEQRGSTVEEELDRVLGEVMAGTEGEDAEGDAEEGSRRPHRPIDDFVSSHTPESLAEARKADEKLNRRLKKRVPADKRPEDLSGIIGVFRGDGTVSGRNFHDYLYGKHDPQ